MKLLKGLLFFILGLLSLISLFIIVCAFSPGLSDRVSDFFYDRMREDGPVEEEDLSNMLPLSDGGTGSNGEASPASRGRNGRSGTDTSGLRTMPEADGDSGYVAPEKSDVDAPEAVAGRNGYIPVQEAVEQVDEKEAEELQKKYTYGETGEGLSFDTAFYPYYGMLSEKGQALYRQIYANAMAVNGIFNPIEPVSQGELRNVFMAVINDHPELFWLDSAYSAKFSRSGECVEIALVFHYLVDDLEGAKNEFNNAAESILAGARGLGSDYEKELYVHNALLDRIAYDLGAPLNQSAYSALVDGRTVCAGYARGMQYLMTELGVPCYYCTGYAGENHAWNIICLDGEYYNVDATWDDTDPNTYDYFNKTDGEFAHNHRREDLSVYLPPCNGTKYGNREGTAAQDDTSDAGSQAGISPQGADGKISLADAGFSETDVLHDMEAYYDDCYNQIMGAGGPVTFDSVVDNENLLMECFNAYDSGSFSEGYMAQVLEELQADGGEVQVEAYALADGRILLHHVVSLY